MTTYAGTAALPSVWRGAADVRGRGIVALGAECAECGAPLGAEGWAANMDAGIAGAGGDVRPIGQALACADCVAAGGAGLSMRLAKGAGGT